MYVHQVLKKDFIIIIMAKGQFPLKLSHEIVKLYLCKFYDLFLVNLVIQHLIHLSNQT